MASDPQASDLLNQLGGVEGLRVALTRFYDRVFIDPMIGYLFTGQDKQRLIEREVEWTARAFGAELPYEGRPLREAHRHHPIRRGHFHRRNQILREVLAALRLPPEAARAWIAHSESLERAILGGATDDARCERTADEGGEGGAPT
jgi:hemoglobin